MVSMEVLLVIGSICFGNSSCAFVDNATLIVTDNATFIEEKCLREVLGCADLRTNTAYVLKQNNTNKTIATEYHELLHLEYWQKKKDAGHPEEMLERDNALRDELGVFDRMIYLKAPAEKSS
jgi:hypothetical protein